MEQSEFTRDNTVFVGQKRPLEYVEAVMHQSEDYSVIMIKARGHLICKAVDVSQMSVNRYLRSWVVSSVRIGTEVRPAETHPSFKEMSVSTIEIDIAGGSV